MEVYCKKFLSYEESIENYKRIFVSHGAFSTSSSTLKTSVACLAPTKAMPADGCRQKQSIDWTEHISKQDNVSLDFCGKTDGGRLYLSSLLHIQHCTPFLRNQQSWRGVVSAPFCYHMTRGEENICAYTQQNWRSKIDPCTKMSNHSWATWKSWPVQPAV